MSVSLETRLPDLFNSAKGAPAAPHALYQRLQFLARVLQGVPKATGADAVLLWLDPQGAITCANINAAGITIGRDATCHVVLADRRISRVHARVYASLDAFLVEDLRSSNGTLVNNASIGKIRVLQDGDVIQIGSIPLAFIRTKSS